MVGGSDLTNFKTRSAVSSDKATPSFCPTRTVSAMHERKALIPSSLSIIGPTGFRAAVVMPLNAAKKTNFSHKDFTISVAITAPKPASVQAA